MSIPHSPAGFKREMRFWELCKGYLERWSRLCAAKMAALHAAVASPNGRDKRGLSRGAVSGRAAATGGTPVVPALGLVV